MIFFDVYTIVNLHVLITWSEVIVFGHPCFIHPRHSMLVSLLATKGGRVGAFLACSKAMVGLLRVALAWSGARHRQRRLQQPRRRARLSVR
jgi:hypothetical protein